MIKAGGFIKTQRHLVHEHSNATEQMPCVDTSLATNLINLLIGLATLGAVIVALSDPPGTTAAETRTVTQEIMLQNMGDGVAFNVHSILYGPLPTLGFQYIS